MLDTMRKDGTREANDDEMITRVDGKRATSS